MDCIVDLAYLSIHLFVHLHGFLTLKQKGIEKPNIDVHVALSMSNLVCKFSVQKVKNLNRMMLVLCKQLVQ